MDKEKIIEFNKNVLELGLKDLQYNLVISLIKKDIGCVDMYDIARSFIKVLIAKKCERKRHLPAHVMEYYDDETMKKLATKIEDFAYKHSQFNFEQFYIMLINTYLYAATEKEKKSHSLTQFNQYGLKVTLTLYFSRSCFKENNKLAYIYYRYGQLNAQQKHVYGELYKINDSIVLQCTRNYFYVVGCITPKEPIKYIKYCTDTSITKAYLDFHSKICRLSSRRSGDLQPSYREDYQSLISQCQEYLHKNMDIYQVPLVDHIVELQSREVNHYLQQYRTYQNYFQAQNKIYYNDTLR